MSRFLFVAPPLAGHVYAAGAVAAVLAERGHEVAWAGPETALRRMLGDAVTVFPTGMRPYRGQRDRGLRAVRSLWDGFVLPYARFTLPAVEKAVAAFAPDVVAVDQHALAGAVAAHRHGVRWASLAPQSMELTRPFRALPKVEEWIRRGIAGAGLSIGDGADPRFSPHLVLAFTSPALTGAHDFPAHYALVGPALGARASVPEFPWAALDPVAAASGPGSAATRTGGDAPARRAVLVTMGTLAEDVARDFYPRMVGALRALEGRVRAVVAAPPGAVPDPPPGTVVLPQVPVLELLPRLSAVVCHAGLNTVCEALAHGVPLVVAPIKHDQPVTAAQVVAAGAGVRVRFGRSGPDELAAALAAVLDEPGYAAAAGRVRDSFAAAGGAPAAASHLEQLAAHS
ncbi:glycosyltransferase [Phytohabitans sp. ZYX-F-186]|uniref:Glycosyltransferase n=1 Tax=Phytohabitans maris TaxID=3071409 RepID=A0ABU0ZX42_9ACTN|nr:nucleotide disphospho-sugar-binding domain-containing protein [Phytohabitans sp. ZYX-F-186]MDQ7910884.1 glycosyltransferase [Phytohabitans sp. ZYX-F-186]